MVKQHAFLNEEEAYRVQVVIHSNKQATIQQDTEVPNERFRLDHKVITQLQHNFSLILFHDYKRRIVSTHVKHFS